VLASAVLVHHKHTGIARVGDPGAVRRPNRILQIARPHRQPLHVRAIRRRRVDIRRGRPTAHKDNPPHSTRKGRQSRRHRHTNKTQDDQNEQATSVHAETPRDTSRRGRARRLSEQTHHRPHHTPNDPPIERTRHNSIRSLIAALNARLVPAAAEADHRTPASRRPSANRRPPGDAPGGQPSREAYVAGSFRDFASIFGSISARCRRCTREA
jgi:hypothetical protein